MTLSLSDVRKVIVDVARELEGRGLMTPLLFSNQALEGSQGRTRLLIQAYMDMMRWVLASLSYFQHDKSQNANQADRKRSRRSRHSKNRLNMVRADNHSSSTRHPPSSSSSSSASQSFSRDLQYAKEYELAWFLRWTMSRITRRKDGTGEICHGIIEWDIYEEWRGRERGE